MENKISIIIPVYNVEKYLDRCVESVVNQTYKNLEIILVDDGSPDNCPQMCDDWKKKDKRIKVIHKENGGVSSARNLGIEKATGDYIAFVDSDDWIDLTMYEKLFQKATETDADMVFCGNRLVYDNGRIEDVIEKDFSELKNKETMGFFSSNGEFYGGGPCRMLVKSEIAKSSKFNLGLRMGEDLFYVLDCIEKAQKIEAIDEILYNYYMNTQSVTHSNDEKYFKSIEDFYIHSKEYVKKKNLDYDYLVKNMFLNNTIKKLSRQKGFIKKAKNLYKENSNFRECFDLKNYKKIQKLEKRSKEKFRNFVVYHKIWWVYKLYVKLFSKVK